MQDFFDQIVRIFERCDPFSVVLVLLPPRDSRWFIFSKPCLSAGKSTLPFFFVSNCSHSALILASRSSRDSPSIAVYSLCYLGFMASPRQVASCARDLKAGSPGGFAEVRSRCCVYVLEVIFCVGGGRVDLRDCREYASSLFTRASSDVGL